MMFPENIRQGEGKCQPSLPDIPSESGSAEGRSLLPGNLAGGQVIPRKSSFSFLAAAGQKAGVQRAAALCRGHGGVPRKSFFLSSPPQPTSSERMSEHFWINDIRWSPSMIVSNDIITRHRRHQSSCLEGGAD